VRAAVGLASANLDTQLQAVDDYVDTEVAAILSAVQALPTSAAIADKILGRAIAGSADGGRTVSQALQALRNKVAIATGTMTVYAADDVTPSWTAAVDTDAAADPITGVDPA
jgi:ubiquinone biosynthesis protein UbiJ